MSVATGSNWLHNRALLLNPRSDTTSGYVGIGLSNPQAKLHVNGNILASGNVQADRVGIGGSADSSYRLYVNGSGYLNGNVGIGSAPSPSYRLYVYGSGDFS